MPRARTEDVPARARVVAAEGPAPLVGHREQGLRLALSWREPLIAALVSAALVGLLVWLIPTAPNTGDGARYLDAILSNFDRGGAAAWHERRVLSIGIVLLLPFDAYLNFHILTVAASFATAMLTWAAAREVGLRGTRALAAIGLVCGTWAIAPNLREYALVDPLAWTFVAAIWLGMLQRRWVLVAILAIVGVTAKEMVAMAAVAAAAAAWDPRQPRATFPPAALIVLAAWATVEALVFILPGTGTDVRLYVWNWTRDGLGSLGIGRVVYLVFASMGALWLLLPLGYRRLPGMVQRATGALVLGALAMLIVGTPERMLAIAFPAFVTAALAATAAWPTWRVWLLAVTSTMFTAHVGGDALPTPLSWAALAVALLLAASAYLPNGRLRFR